MTDAQIKLYAALRVRVPGSWRIRGVSPSSRLFRGKRVWNGNDFLVVLERRRSHRVEVLKHAVPIETLEDPRYTEGTIALDVRQILDDLAVYGAADRPPAEFRPFG